MSVGDLRGAPGAQLWLDAAGSACTACWTEGLLTLRWQALPERRIALLRMPQPQVDFAYNGLDDALRYQRQRFFDLSTQRGGGYSVLRFRTPRRCRSGR